MTFVAQGRATSLRYRWGYRADVSTTWMGGMQPTDLQVERSLAALRLGDVDEHGAGPGAIAEMPPGLVEELAAAPPVRPDRLAEARQRLAVGEQPDADALAARMVGRLVCDRLR